MKISKRNMLPGVDMMGLILVVWLCALPFIGLLIIPLFGVKAAVVVAASLLIAMLEPISKMSAEVKMEA